MVIWLERLQGCQNTSTSLKTLVVQVMEDADNPLDMYYRYEVDYETAGQSTGMRDKKNDEIFEDDVLFNDITKEYHLVFFDSSSASFNMRLVKKSVGLPVTTASSTSRVMRADRMSRDFEIIGNTHEPQTLPKEVFDGLNP